MLCGLYEAGVFGFKAFLVPSGVEEFAPVTEGDLREAMPIVASLGAVLLVHSELPGPIMAAAAELAGASPVRYSTWLQSRPAAAENEAIALLIRLSREFNCRVHIVHLSSSEALACLRRAREEGVPISVETCPHYLCFAAEDIPDAATSFKCAPPIRERQNREHLWSALASGLLGQVVTDHSPCPPEMKCSGSGDFMRAWGGIASLQLSLPIIWTEARRRGHRVEDLARWMCVGPAALAGLQHRKGMIAAGYDADLVIWDPEATFKVDPDALHHRHQLTPYAGQTLQGVVGATFVRGQQVYHRGGSPAGPAGQALRRGAA